jgi:sugar lactone lactonase YvrE
MSRSRTLERELKTGGPDNHHRDDSCDPIAHARRRSLKGIVPASVAALALLLPGAAPGRATAFGFLNEFGTSGAGKLGPVAGGVASDADGNVYVVDAAANRIVKYDFNGRFITAFGGSRLKNAAGLASDGKNVYVVDAGHSRVLEFDGNGVLLRSMGHAAVGPGQLVAPVSVAIGTGGRVYVTDDGLKRVVVFTSDGSPARTFGSIGHPFGIAVAPVGNVWVSDYSAQRLYEFTSGGRAIRVVSAGSSPRGAASDSAGNLYVADSSAQKVLTFNANGVAQGSFGAPGIAVGQMNSPTWVATDCRGNVYVIDTASAIGGEFVSKGLKYGDPAAIPPPCLPTGSATGTVLVNGAPFTGGTIPDRSKVDVTNGTLDLSTETGPAHRLRRRRAHQQVPARAREREGAATRRSAPDRRQLLRLRQPHTRGPREEAQADPAPLGQGQRPLSHQGAVQLGKRPRDHLADRGPLRRDAHPGPPRRRLRLRPSEEEDDHRARRPKLPRQAKEVATRSFLDSACCRAIVQPARMQLLSGAVDQLDSVLVRITDEADP